jgi:hypothetical protein
MESAGSVNAYVCEKGHQVVTIHRDEGTTPMMMGCRYPVGPEGRNFCLLPAESSFGVLPWVASVTGGPPEPAPPTWEWYRPGRVERLRLRGEVRDYVGRGGLLARRIV